MSRFENEKVIMNMSMASYLVLCGCKLNRTRIDIRDRTRFVFFFENSRRLSELMDVYPKYRETLYKIGAESLDIVRMGERKQDERV